MKIYSKEEFLADKKARIKEIDKGALFIYPTDTIYGIGCNALDEKAVLKVKETKKRQNLLFSIIAPSKEWIRKNCEINKLGEKWLKKLPGKYTLILNLINTSVVSEAVNKENRKTLGVRIPKHWISEFVEEYGKPIITTSANISGKDVITSEKNIDEELKKHIKFMITEGELRGKGSKIIDLTKEKEGIIRK